jgi:hypothetical protein
MMRDAIRRRRARWEGVSVIGLEGVVGVCVRRSGYMNGKCWEMYWYAEEKMHAASES